MAPKTYSDGRGGVYTVHVDQDDKGNISSNTVPLKDDVLSPVWPCPVEEETEVVEITMQDDVFINLALRAHELDLTLNKYINELLKESLKEEVEESEKHKILFNIDK